MATLMNVGVFILSASDTSFWQHE